MLDVIRVNLNGLRGAQDCALQLPSLRLRQCQHALKRRVAGVFFGCLPEKTFRGCPVPGEEQRPRCAPARGRRVQTRVPHQELEVMPEVIPQSEACRGDGIDECAFDFPPVEVNGKSAGGVRPEIVAASQSSYPLFGQQSQASTLPALLSGRFCKLRFDTLFLLGKIRGTFRLPCLLYFAVTWHWQLNGIPISPPSPDNDSCGYAGKEQKCCKCIRFEHKKVEQR